jgi:hypothetical protein
VITTYQVGQSPNGPGQKGEKSNVVEKPHDPPPSGKPSPNGRDDLNRDGKVQDALLQWAFLRKDNYRIEPIPV